MMHVIWLTVFLKVPSAEVGNCLVLGWSNNYDSILPLISPLQIYTLPPLQPPSSYTGRFVSF